MCHKYAITVIVPIFNGESYIESLIAQFNNQHFKDFGVIFIDDGSTDGTNAKLHKEVSANAKFEYEIVLQKNKGVSAARNAGLALADSEYVCFIDTDDIIPPNFLYELYTACSKSNCRIAMAPTCREINRLDQDKKISFSVRDKNEVLKEYLFGNNRYSICAALFARECFKGGLRFPEGYKYSEDVYVLWQLLASTEKVAVFESALYFYYQNPFSSMHKELKKDRAQAVILMKRLEPIISELAPGFAKDFCRFAVARHYWSILWQAARYFRTFAEFQEYCNFFCMAKEIKNLFDYPDKRVAISSKMYCRCPVMYYITIRMYVMGKGYIRQLKNKGRNYT